MLGTCAEMYGDDPAVMAGIARQIDMSTGSGSLGGGEFRIWLP